MITGDSASKIQPRDRSSSLPGKFSGDIDHRTVAASFKSKKVSVSLKPVQCQALEPSGKVHFEHWHSRFRNNAVLVSKVDLDKVQLKPGQIALLDGVPHQVEESREANPGEIHMPPFCQHKKDGTQKIGLSSAAMKEQEISHASIKITQCQSGLSDGSVIEISPGKLEKAIKSCCYQVPIIENEQYFCTVKAYRVRHSGAREATVVSLIFTVENFQPEASGDIDTVFTFNDDSRLYATSSIAQLHLPNTDQNPESYIVCTDSSLLNGSNFVCINHASYRGHQLYNQVRPLIRINGFLFCLSISESGVDRALFNPSSARNLQPSGKLSATSYTYHFVNPDLPDATEACLTLDWLNNTDDKCANTCRTNHSLALKRGRLPPEEALKALVRKELGSVPLQKGRIFQVPVALDSYSRGLLEATITNVSGPADETGTDEPGGGHHAFWVSDNTQLHLAMSPGLAGLQDKVLDDSESITARLCQRVGGISKQVKSIVRDIILPRVLYQKGLLDSMPSRGIIFHGPPGTGKTRLAKTLADTLKVSPGYLTVVKGPELMDRFIGESERKTRDLFAPAELDARTYGRSSPLHVIIIDEIEAFLGIREAAREETIKVVGQFLGCLDGVEKQENLLIIGTTNDLTKVDDAVKREGRLGYHYEIGLPDEQGRKEILEIHCRQSNIRVNLDEGDYLAVARKTAGKSGAFLASLVRKAEIIASVGKADIAAISMGDLEKLTPDMGEINVSLLLRLLEEENEKNNVEAALKEQLPAPENFYKLECQHNRAESTTDSASKANTIQKFVNRVAASPNNATTTILIAGEPGTGKTCLARQWIQEGPFTHLAVIKAGELVTKSGDQASQLMESRLRECRESKRSVVLIKDIDLLCSEEGALAGPKVNLLQPWAKEKQGIKDRTCVMLVTAQKPEVQQAFPAQRFNRVITLEKLSQDDMETILKEMNTSQQDIKRITGLFSEKLSIGDFLELIKPCYSTSVDGSTCWDLEALAADIEAFYDARPNKHPGIYN